MFTCCNQQHFAFTKLDSCLTFEFQKINIRPYDSLRKRVRRWNTKYTRQHKLKAGICLVAVAAARWRRKDDFFYPPKLWQRAFAGLRLFIHNWAFAWLVGGQVENMGCPFSFITNWLGLPWILITRPPLQWVHCQIDGAYRRSIDDYTSRQKL